MATTVDQFVNAQVNKADFGDRLANVESEVTKLGFVEKEVVQTASSLKQLTDQKAQIRLELKTSSAISSHYNSGP